MSQQFKYPFAYKMQAVNLYEQNGNRAEVARFLGICPSLVDLWVQQYYLGGVAALIPKSNGIKYDPQMRISIIEDLQNKRVSLREASAIFGVSSRTLGRWLQSVKDGGFSSLFDRVPSNCVPGMGRKKKEEPLTELEQLREENMRLRAELDLIKKLNALVANRCKPTRKSVRKPSKD
jgi:transposase-like protein